MTISWTRLPLRFRLALVFAACMSVLLTAVGMFVYARAGRDLLATVDAGLRSRAEVVSTDVRDNGPVLANVGANLIERDEAFVQLVSPSGTLEQSSAIVRSAPMLPASAIAGITHPTMFDQRVSGIDNITRILAVPILAQGKHSVLLVGSSLQDRRDEMLGLAFALAIGGGAALVVVSFAGWLLASAVLRPVERMRRDAANISSDDLERRLTLPPADDEIAHLARTLNTMLDRLAGSFARERRLLDNASHELRTPLAILKAELDLAISRDRSPDELLAALRSANDETTHLVKLAEDLLVVSRAEEGGMPIHRAEAAVDDVLHSAVEHSRPRAAEAGIELLVEAPATVADIDADRVRQALDDLLDNAIRHTPSGGSILVSAQLTNGELRIDVTDSGAGFPPAFLTSAFEPFSRGSGGDPTRTGLGLAIVRAIAEAHGGRVEAMNGEGGAVVTIVIPMAPTPARFAQP
ncbi:MAG: two-component system, OmpR family, sensor kinase [Actinomycetota bacterium]|nr:two-component system, OmpR family, sensor kinase [Actinomycetota bacterium]